MCDALARNNIVNLYVPFCSESKKKLKGNYLLKNKINVKKIFDRRKKLNFFSRISYSLKIINNIKRNNNQNSFCLSRSIIFGILASILNIKTILEIHHELSGLTNHTYYFLKKLGYLKNLKYIFIHKNLVKKFNVKKDEYLCLDDAIDLSDFKNYKTKKLHNTCVYIKQIFLVI